MQNVKDMTNEELIFEIERIKAGLRYGYITRGRGYERLLELEREYDIRREANAKAGKEFMRKLFANTQRNEV